MQLISMLRQSSLAFAARSHFLSQAHEERCTDIAWHPQALCPDASGNARSPEALSFATASADGSAKLWNMAGTCLHTCGGHTRRLARLAFHPAGTICPWLQCQLLLAYLLAMCCCTMAV